MKNLALFFFLLALSIPGFSQKTKTEVSRFQYQTNTQTSTPQIVDTFLTGTQAHNPLYSTFSSWSDLGNTGLPALINQYRPIREALNPLMFEGSDGYGINNTNLVFYSANSPFSILGYNSGGTADKNGQTIKALFARNLKKKSNITVLGNYSNSDGHFSKQKCNSSAIRVNYLLIRKNYNLVTGFSRNSFSFNENGGLKSDEQLIGAYLPNLIPVNLSGAATKMSVLTWQGVQTGSIRLPGKHSITPDQPDSTVRDSLSETSSNKHSLRVVHAFRISSVSRKYTDSSSDSDFYQNTYSEDKATKDSMSFLSWTNDISLLSDTLHIGKHPVVLKGGINPDFYRYQYSNIVSNGYSLGLNGKITRRDQFNFIELAGNWTAAGYSAGDYKLAATYSLIPGKIENGSEISFELFVRGCSPDPIIREYQSNHFRWTNDFLRQHESGLNVKWNVTEIRSALAASIISNKGWIYFDTTGIPAQLKDRMTVLSLKGSKDFTAGAFRSSISALVQYSTSDKIRLPLFVGSTSTFMHHDIRFPSTGGEMQVEYGIDLSYSTGFYGYAYMPATGIFFAENEKVLGNYPNLNVFAQIKVKRTRMFVEWVQTFAGLLPEQSFAVLHYPSMRPHLKYGIYWHFYD
ncbi:MAG: hypothetical protein D4R64_11560 [Porphyromonadaceae bacterium]|nr:MAG: hypothetical protein D4R64_11560 [Porphyromonadaceae bacterium]